MSAVVLGCKLRAFFWRHLSAAMGLRCENVPLVLQVRLVSNKEDQRFFLPLLVHLVNPERDTGETFLLFR